ncbi:hypothetical protein ACF0H5_014586 [Mactra antiquata]
MSLVKNLILVLILIVLYYGGYYNINCVMQRDRINHGNSKSTRNIEKHSESEEVDVNLNIGDVNDIGPIEALSMKGNNDQSLSRGSTRQKGNKRLQPTVDKVRWSLEARKHLEWGQLISSQYSTAIFDGQLNKEKTNVESYEANRLLSVSKNEQKDAKTNKNRPIKHKAAFRSFNMAECPVDSCDRQICPWKFTLDIQPNRTPIVLFRAECTSLTCNFPDIPCKNCKRLIQKLTYCDTLIIDLDVYIDSEYKVIPWPVACICRHRLGSGFYNSHQDSGPMTQLVSSYESDNIEGIEPQTLDLVPDSENPSRKSKMHNGKSTSNKHMKIRLKQESKHDNVDDFGRDTYNEAD